MAKKIDDVTTKMEELLREQIMGQKSTPEVPSKKKKTPVRKKDLFKKEKEELSTKGLVEYADIIGEAHPKGKFYFKGPLNINDWPEEVRKDIPKPSDDRSWDHQATLVALLGIEEHIPTLLVGPPSTGKTTLIKELCARLNRPYMRINGQAGVEPADYVGMNVPQNGKLIWQDGPVSHAVRHGYVLAYDEPFKVDAAVNMCFQWLFEDQDPKLLLYGNNNEADRFLTPHEEFSVVLCDNVRGTGDGLDKYAATAIQDSSTLNRMRLKAFMNYLPPTEENKLLHKKFPDLTVELAKKIVQLANLIRDGWKEGQLELPYGPRDLFSFASLALKYRNPGLAFNMTYYQGCSDEERGVVRKMWEDVEFSSLL